MQGNIIVTYKNQDELELLTLGESLVGLQESLNELVKISRINGEVKIRANKIENGSIEVHIALLILTHLPFNKVVDLYNFLQVSDPNLYQEALTFFSTIDGMVKNANDFVSQRAFEAIILERLLEKFIPLMFKFVRTQKQTSNTNDGKISEVYALELHDAIKKGTFVNFLKPVVEGQVSEIAVCSKNKEVAQVITAEIVGDYLPKEEEILPDLKNGEEYSFVGQIRVLQSNRGESMTLRLSEIENEYPSVVAFPADGKTTDDYARFYKKDTNLTLEVLRKSLYEKPKFIMKNITLLQNSLFQEEHKED